MDKTQYDVLYYFEHKYIPQMFFSEKEDFLKMIVEEKYLYRVLSTLLGKALPKNPYGPDEISLKGRMLDAEHMMVRITFPEPEAEPLCYFMYLIADRKFRRPAVYTVEMGHGVDGHEPVLGGWTADGKHENYGTCTLDEDETLMQCVRLYLEKK